MSGENETYENRPDPQTILNWAHFYSVVLGWVLIPIHKFMGYRHDGTERCSCELTGKKWKGCTGKAGKHPWGDIDQGAKYGHILTPQQGLDIFAKALNRYPDGVNIGVRTGRLSGIWAIDVDMGTEKDGVASMEAWLTKNNLSYADLNSTLVAYTGGGGWHHVFAYPPNVDKIPTVAPHAGMGPHVDLKGDGGYIIVEPSVHRTGKIYRWSTSTPIGKDALKLAPEVIITAVRKQQRGLGSLGGVGGTGGAYTPSLVELQEYAEELLRKKSPTKNTAGRHMVEALKGNAIADEGGGHDAYRNICFYIALKWKRCDPSEVLTYFEDSVQARFAHKADVSTDMANLVDSMQTALDKVIDEAKSWTGQLALTGDGERAAANDANLLLYFRNHEAWQGVFGYDLRLNKPVYLKRPPLVRVSDELDMTSDKSETALWFQTKGEMMGKVAANDYGSAVISASKDNEFDPLVDMLNELKGKWDGHPRLATHLQRVAGVEDDAWSRLVFRKFMISAVARIMVPGCKVDTMFILEGDQGFKKSTFFSTLIPHKRYFSDGIAKVKHDVETIRLIHSGPLIFELGELSGLRKQEVDEIKAFLSAEEDHLRPLYEAPRKVLRRVVFVGSTNLNDYLRDSTGGRRFWPVIVTRVIDIATVKEEREQLWAEALAAYGDGKGLNDGNGERWWLETAEEHALAKIEQDRRYEEDIWTQKVRTYLTKKKVAIPEEGASTQNEQLQEVVNEKLPGEYVTVSQVAEHALDIEMKNARGGEAKRIESILRKDSWIPTRIYIDGKRTRVWKRPPGE